jgi:hypothetical protein
MSTADDVATGASWGGWVGAYAGYLRGITRGGPGFSNSRVFRGVALDWVNQVRAGRTAGGPASATAPPANNLPPANWPPARWPEIQWECATDAQCEFQDCILDGGTPTECLPFDISLPEDWEGSATLGGPEKLKKPGWGDPKLRKPPKIITAMVSTGFPAIDELGKYVIPGILAFPQATISGVIAAVLGWPTATASDDVLCQQTSGGIVCASVPGAIPSPGRARGRRRPRAVKPKARRPPRALPRPSSGPVTLPRAPGKAVPRPTVIENILLQGDVAPPLIDTRSSSSSSSSSSRAGELEPIIITAQRIPVPAIPKAPAIWPYIRDQIIAPLVKEQLLSLAQPKLGRIKLPQAQPFPELALAPQTDPLTSFYSAAVPFSATKTKACSCATTKRKKKKSCSNPVSSKRKFTRGNQKYITTTRRIECPA